MLPTRIALLVLLLSAGTVAAQPKDRLGDPLPAGALRAHRHDAADARPRDPGRRRRADGKRIAAVSDSMLGVWDVPSGKQLLNLPWLHKESQNGWPPVIGFTADGKSVACLACLGPKDGSWLGLLDIATGKMGRMLGKPFDRWCFTRDGRMALRAEPADMSVRYTIESLDLPSGRPHHRWTFEYEPAFVRAMMGHGVRFHLSPDGKRLAAHEEDGKRQQLVRVFASATGVEICRWPLGWPLLRGFAFSEDGKLLASAAGTSETTARVWEIATAKELSRWSLKGGINTGRPALAFAPDGNSLFMTDAAGIGRWDWRKGKRLQHYPECGGPIALLDGGKTIAVQGPIGAIRLLDVATGKDRCPLPHAGEHFAIAPDSRHIAWSEGGAIVLADGSGAELRRWPAHDHFVGPLAFAPDGKTLASAGTDMRIRLWDIPDGRLRRTIIRTGVQRLFFSPDGRRLVTSGGWDVCLWDAASGKRLKWWYGRGEAPVMAPSMDVLAVPNRTAQRLQLVEPEGGKELHTLAGFRGVVTYSGEAGDRSAPFPPLFAPDSRRLLTGIGGSDPDFDALAAWDVASGQRLPYVLRGQQMMLDHVAFSPDGERIAALRTDGRLVLLRANDGTTARLLGTSTDPLAAPPVFTPDGRTLITAIKNRVHIWEVASGGEIVRRTGHQDVVRELTLSADGRLLASGSADRTTLIWDLAHLAPGGAAPLAALWDDLASTDAPRGRRAVEALVAQPAKTVALLRKRLPVAAPDPKQIALACRVEQRRFRSTPSGRARARRPGRNGRPRAAASAGRQAARRGARRIANLIKKLDAPVLTSTQLRAVRGVQVLETLASPAARRLLDALAKGPADARPTRKAQAAVARLRTARTK